MTEKITTRVAAEAEQVFDFDTQLSDKEIDLIKRQTKYCKQYIDLLDRHLAAGDSFGSFAAVIKVNETTLYAWLKEYPEFAAVKKKYFKRKTKLYACN